MRRNRQQGGAIVIIVAYASVALALLTIGMLYVGRWTNQAEEAQNQADAVSMAIMEIARSEGISNIRDICSHRAIQALLAQNGNRTVRMDGNCGRFIELRNPDGTTSLQFVINTNSDLEVGPLIAPHMGGQVNTLRSTARAGLTQENFDEAERRRYKLLLVLDYSGSMGANFGGSTRLATLKRAVNGLLDRDFEIDYGLVMFATDVFRTEGIGPNSVQRIRQAINQGTADRTNYEAALNASRDLFGRVDDFGQNILFISDGAPTEGGDPIPPTIRLWNDGVTIFTLNIGGGGAQADTLRDMSGSRERPGDAEYYFEARNERDMLDTFGAIVASLLCSVGPLQGNIDRPDLLRAFLRDANGAERALPLRPNLADPAVAATLAFNYDPVEKKIRLTRAACDEVTDRDAEIVVRYGQLNLVQ